MNTTATAFPCADRASWLMERRAGLGASDAAAVLGVSPWKSPLTVFAEKLGLDGDDDPNRALERLEWGLALEEPIAQRYARETGRPVENPGRFTILRAADRPFIQATLDRETLDPVRGPGVVEIKTTGFIKRDEWVDDPPLHYQIQVQHQLAVTGYRWGSLAVLIGGQQFRWCDIERNDAFIEALIEREAAFWQRVQDREPPTIDDSAVCLDLLRRLFPAHTVGKTIGLPADADDWDRDRMQAIADEDDAKARRRLAESHLIAALGDAECGLLPCGVKYTFKASPRKGYAVASTTVRSLRRMTT